MEEMEPTLSVSLKRDDVRPYLANRSLVVLPAQ